MAQHSADQAVHEAARAGLADKLAEMLALDPSLIDAKGVDARTPLRCGNADFKRPGGSERWQNLP